MFPFADRIYLSKRRRISLSRVAQVVQSCKSGFENLFQFMRISEDFCGLKGSILNPQSSVLKNAIK